MLWKNNRRSYLSQKSLSCYEASALTVPDCRVSWVLMQKRLVDVVHHLGGSVRREVGPNITHVVANACCGEKYR